MTVIYASRTGVKGRRKDGTMVYGVIPQFDGALPDFDGFDCGAAAEATRLISQTRNARPSKGSPWPPTATSIRRETGDTSGGLNPSQTTRASYNEYGVAFATPRIAAKSIVVDKLEAAYAVDILVAYGPIDDYLSGSPGFRGNHRVTMLGYNTDTVKVLWPDSLYDGRRSGIPLGPRWIPLSVVFKGASLLDLGGGTRLSTKYGYDDAYYIPSLTRLDQKKYRVVVPPGTRFGSYDISNGWIVDRDLYRTGGFSADCTAPQNYRTAPNATDVPKGTYSLVKLTSGGRKGMYIRAKFAREV
jgi:hypothetical protein